MKATDEQQNKSAITDHAIRENHIIDWNGMTQNRPQNQMDQKGHSYPQAQWESHKQTLDLTFYRQPTTSFFSVTRLDFSKITLYDESTHF